MIRTAAIAAVILIALSGCAGGISSVAISGQGAKQGAETRTLDCGSNGTIAVGFQGQGTVTVTVTDGAGAAIYTETFQGGQEGASQTLSGAAGEWTLRATFSGLYGGYQGQYGITLTC